MLRSLQTRKDESVCVCVRLPLQGLWQTFLALINSYTLQMLAEARGLSVVFILSSPKVNLTHMF